IKLHFKIAGLIKKQAIFRVFGERIQVRTRTESACAPGTNRLRPAHIKLRNVRYFLRKTERTGDSNIGSQRNAVFGRKLPIVPDIKFQFSKLRKFNAFSQRKNLW